MSEPNSSRKGKIFLFVVVITVIALLLGTLLLSSAGNKDDVPVGVPSSNAPIGGGCGVAQADRSDVMPFINALNSVPKTI